MKRLFVVLMSLLSCTTSFAYDALIDGIYYKFSGKGAVVTYKQLQQGNRYISDYNGDIVIPESVTYNNISYIVNQIDEGAFYNCSRLNSISISNSVVTIGFSAFQGCYSLTFVTIPNSVTSIGDYAFMNCTALSEVSIGNGLRTYGASVFEGCNNIKSLKLDCNVIYDWFANNQNLQNVIIGENVKSINSEAFRGCINLAAFTIPDNVTSIAERTFEGCYFSSSSFINNSSLESSTLWGAIICDEETSEGLLIKDGKTIFCRKWANNVTIPENTISIGDKTFNGCTEITSIIIPVGVTEIGSSAFSGCTGLKSIVIPESVTNIDGGAFINCPRLSDIYVCSTEPADCYGIGTFECSSWVRDKYDVYEYAVLHVPMGAKEKYAAAYEWRYFKKIKEDLEINGQVFYTTLAVNQAGEGYVQHYVKADEPYTIFIGSDEGLRINTVMFNGEDVTDRLVDGYYTTPNITRPSKISISFEQSVDNVRAIAEDNLHVYGNDGSLYVAGIEGPKDLSVYTLDGKLVESRHQEGDTRLNLNEGVYIVKVGDRTFKVSM